MLFAVFEPIQVLPRIRLAPGFSLVDQSGETLTSDDGRGGVTLYNFAPVDCGECGAMFETMREIRDRVAEEVDLGDLRFRLVTIALDASDPASLTAAAEASGADGDRWRWAGAHERRRREIVGDGFRTRYDAGDPSDFDQAFVIVDGKGLIRGEYRYATLAPLADKLTRHIGLMAAEVRGAEGAAALLYEAAHMFLCYP